MGQTSAQEVSYMTFADRLKNPDLTKKDLIALGEQEFNVNIAETMKKPVIIDQLLRIHEETCNKARNMNEKAAALFLNADENEKVVPVRFIPQDFAHASVEFTPDCGKGIRDPKNPERNPNGLSELPRFKLIPSEVYPLPICVIRFLESLTYRDSKPKYNADGFIEGNVPIIKPRFILQIQYSDDQLRSMGTRDV